MYAPRWLFLYPGFFLMLLGFLTLAVVLPGPLRLGSVIFDVHTLLAATAAILVGSEILLFFILAKQHAINAGLLREGPNFRFFRRVTTLERAVTVGGVLIVAGLAGFAWAIGEWGSANFGKLDYSRMMRLVVPSVTSLALGVQVIMAAFVSGILDLKVTSGQGPGSEEP